MRSYSTFDRPKKKSASCLRNSFSQPTSKSLVLVLVWIVAVGFVKSATVASPYYGLTRLYTDEKVLLYTVESLYIILALGMMCYPLGGLLTDVYFSRYKIIRTSLIMMTLSMLIALIELVLTIQLNIDVRSHIWIKIAYVIGGGSVFFVLSMGLAGFTTNIVQFGLDQLLDAPSNKLGAFVHLYVWADRLGHTAFDTVYYIKQCYDEGTGGKGPLTVSLLYALPVVCFTVLSAMLLLNCFTHRMFNKERVKYNPYKMILRVLNFTRKHKGPVGHPSAFAYCDNFQPTRMDYAKERYGGPFTTSDVEDVKTFIRVFLMLLSLGPIFMIVVSTAFYLFATYAIHTGTRNMVGHNNCSADWVLLQSGLMSDIVSTLTLPLYTWLFFSVLSTKNMLPKILNRIQIAAVLFFLTPLNMLVVDLTGHVLSVGTYNQTCMFVQQYIFNSTGNDSLLHLHWSVLIFPNITKTLALDLIMASTFEFISAQSPHTMKGVLVGLLFAVRGFFQLMGAVTLPPFSAIHTWKRFSRETPQISCEFSYYLVIVVGSLVGLMLFVIAARKYQYRKREEEPYSQSRVEEIYDRMLREREVMRTRITHKANRDVPPGIA